MKILYPTGNSIGYMIFGALLIHLLIPLWMTIGGTTFLFFIMGVYAIYMGFIGFTKRTSQPLEIKDGILSFYKNGKLIQVETKFVDKVWVNRSGFDKRISILHREKGEIDIPMIYGLDSVSKKINMELFDH